jgi:POT family proton-dependent oligopeptide transporter
MKKDSEQPQDETTLNDVKQLGTWAAIGSLGYVFWVVGGMEMVERLAFYGVRSLAAIYNTRPVSEGGLGVTMLAYGTLLTVWTLLQSLVPIFTGGLSDRYGYKQTIFISTVVKCVGYLIMALFHSYTGFFAGAVFLAIGTALFKPGIQGTLVRCTNRQNSSMAWGVFYQTVNIGAWIGPLIALQMRQLDWAYVFYTNAGFICLNFILLCTYREPGKDERLARQADVAAGKTKQSNLLKESLQELRKPHLWIYLLIFCVWWFMFPMLWDVLPKYVDDWVDTSAIVSTLFGEGGTSNGFLNFILGMSKDGKSIEPEGIVNINSGIIMITCFIFAGLSARMRATTSLLLGTICVIAALVLFGMFTLAWCCVGAMVVFSIGEMLASPKYSEFLGNIAPPDKKAMWIGFSQAPIMAGGTLEAWVGPRLYHAFSDKEVFARELLEEKGMSAGEVEKIPMGEGFAKLVEVTGQTPEAVTRTLYEAHNVALVWYFFAFVGVVSAIMIYSYGLWIKKLAEKENI